MRRRWLSGLSACASIRDITDNLPKDCVVGDKKRFEAMLMNLYVIGEVAKKIPQKARGDDDEVE